MTDPTGTTTRTYDELNRVTSKTVPGIGRTDYGYDIINGIAGLEAGWYGESTTDPKGNAAVKIYDKTGRLIKVIADGTTTYSYFDNGSLQSVVYPNGCSEVYTYFSDNSLSTLTNRKSDGTALETYSYTYDAAGNMVSKTDGKGTTAYTYDQVNRLLTVTEPGGKATSYSYTAAGNRATETITEGTNTTVKTYTFNAQNRLQSIITQLNGVTVEITGYTWDNNGNQLSSESTAYVEGIAQTPETTSNTYDDLNQLVLTVTPEGTSITSTYNGEGIRVGKQSGSTVTRYLYEGDRVILELDGSGNQTARNLYGINQIARVINCQTAYYLYNGHADTTKLIGTSGEILNSYYYDAFDNNTEASETIDNPYRYSGCQYDKETKTYYVMARMYDPETGRFLQEDTYRGNIKDPLSLNLYTYCHNEPLMYNDPTGHFFEGIVKIFNKAVNVVKEAASAAGSFAAGVVGTTFNTVVYEPLYMAGKAAGWAETKLKGTKHITNATERFKKNNIDVTLGFIDSLVSNKKALKAGKITANAGWTAAAVFDAAMMAKNIPSAIKNIGTAISNIPKIAEASYNGIKNISASVETLAGNINKAELFDNFKTIMTSTKKGNIKLGGWFEKEGVEANTVAWKNGWRTPDGKFASPASLGKPGALAEQEVWDAIKQKDGWDVIEGRVSVRNETGQLRVYDGAAISPSGKVIGLEVKSGSATKTAGQRAFDELLNSSPYNKAYGVAKSKGIVIDRSIEIRK